MARTPTTAVNAEENPRRESHGPSLLGNDSQIERDRTTRAVVFIVGTAAAVFAPALMGASIAGSIGFLIGLAGGVKAAISFVGPRFIIRVPQAQIFVTINGLYTFFGGKEDPNVVYGPGDHIAYPWESRSEKGNLSQDIITLPFSDEMPGRDTRLMVKASMQFRVPIKRARNFVGVDQSTIQGGIIDIIKSKVSSKLAGMSADQAKAEIDKLNQYLMGEFGFAAKAEGSETPTPEEAAADKDPNVSKLEEQYGIEVVAVTIAEIDLPPRVQESRDALDQADQVFTGVAKLMGLTPDELRVKMASKEVSLDKYNETVDRFFVQSGAAKMDVKSYKFNDVEALGNAIGNAVRGGRS